MATDEHDLKNMNPTLIFITREVGVDSTARPLTIAAQAEPDDIRGSGARPRTRGASVAPSASQGALSCLRDCLKR